MSWRCKKNTKISELKDGLKKVNVSGVIVSIEKPRNVVSKKTGDAFTVASAQLKDSSGVVTLSLFGEQALTPEGSEVEISNGYTSSYLGKLQLNVGRYGTLIIA